jgi:hypothetical protein
LSVCLIDELLERGRLSLPISSLSAALTQVLGKGQGRNYVSEGGDYDCTILVQDCSIFGGDGSDGRVALA